MDLMTEAIDSAKKEIFISIYHFKEDSLVDLLNRKIDSGVKVTIVCEPYNVNYLKKKVRSSATIIPKKSRGIMHRKILIIDQKTCYLGSANFNFESLIYHDNLMIGIYAPKLCNYIIQQIVNNTSSKKTFCPPKNTYFLPIAKAKFWLLPSTENAPKELIRLIKKSNHSIFVCMYTLTHEKLTEALIEAASKGISVTVILDQNQSKHVNLKMKQKLENSSVHLYLGSNQQLCHHKLMIVDQKTLVVGSSNWTKSAFEKNEDCFIVFFPIKEPMSSFLSQIQKQMIGKSWKIPSTHKKESMY